MLDPAENSVSRYQGADGGLEWEYFSLAIPTRLRPFVREVTGYSETTPGLLQRREFAGGRVVMILEFGPPLRIFERGGGPGDDIENRRAARRFARGFVSGVDDGLTLTEHDGFQSGMQVNFTPPGARLFFGVPMLELSGRVIALEDLAADLSALPERLYDLRDWNARFALLGRLLSRRLDAATAGAGREAGFAATDWAFQEMELRGGALNVADLALELGYSQKHLIHLFRQHVGVAPRLLGRILRFQRFMEFLRAAPQPWSDKPDHAPDAPSASGSWPSRSDRPDWAQLAARFGYYDQSHLIRETRAFTGRTPARVREILQAVHGAPED